MSFAGDLRIVLRTAGFRRLYATRLLSQAADGCFQVALGSYVFFNPDQATTTAKAAAAFTVLLLPYSLVGPFAGVLLDRLSRQRVLATVNLARAALVGGVAAFVAAGASGWPFFTTALIVLSVNRFVLAALSASLPHVVEPDELVMGNSVSTTSGTVIALAGGGVGFLLRALLGHGNGANAAILVTSAVVYAGSSLVARTIAANSLGPDFDPSRPEAAESLRRVVSGLVAGAQHVWSKRPAGYALATITVHRFFWGLSTISTVLLYRNFFGSDDDDDGFGGLALVVGAAGLGVVAAAWLTPIFTRRIGKESWIVTLLVSAAVIEASLVTLFTTTAIVIAAFFLGLVAQGVKICVDTIVQQSVDDAFRGRVFSLYDVVFNVSFVAAAAVGVVLLPMSGKSYVSVGLIAAGYLGAAIGYRIAMNRLRGRGTPAGQAPTGWLSAVDQAEHAARAR